MYLESHIRTAEFGVLAHLALTAARRASTPSSSSSCSLLIPLACSASCDSASESSLACRLLTILWAATSSSSLSACLSDNLANLGSATCRDTAKSDETQGRKICVSAVRLECNGELISIITTDFVTGLSAPCREDIFARGAVIQLVVEPVQEVINL